MNTDLIITELLHIKAQASETIKRVDAVMKRMEPAKKKKSELTEEDRLRIRNGFAKRNIKPK